MMMLFMGIAIVFCGIFIWQFMNMNGAFNWDAEEKPKGMSQTASDILDERYANGELSREEYLMTLEDIEVGKQNR